MVVAITAGATLIFAAGATASATSVKEPPSKVGVPTSTPVPRSVITAKFINQFGAPETLGSLKGKTVFIFPYLTLCGDTCPFTTGNALQLQGLITAHHLRNVVVVGIDVDPYRDNLARINAYDKLFGGTFQLWTEAGRTTTPVLTQRDYREKNPVGQGDTNPNLTAVEKFLGWTVAVVPQSTPPNTDWMAPHDQLSYDINHSDGFWIVNVAQRVSFVSGDYPAFTGTLSRVLSSFMGYKSNIYKQPVYKRGWTAAEAFQAVEWVESQ